MAMRSAYNGQPRGTAALDASSRLRGSAEVLDRRQACTRDFQNAELGETGATKVNNTTDSCERGESRASGGPRRAVQHLQPQRSPRGPACCDLENPCCLTRKLSLKM